MALIYGTFKKLGIEHRLLAKRVGCTLYKGKKLEEYPTEYEEKFGAEQLNVGA